MTFLRIIIPLYLLFEHDLFGKPVPTFPDHALAQPIARGHHPVYTGDFLAGDVWVRSLPLFCTFERGSAKPGRTMA
jgi:hypothetical protein